MSLEPRRYQEDAYAFEIARAYIDNLVGRGLSPDDFVGRFSFNLNVLRQSVEQVAKFRPLANVGQDAKEEYGVADKKNLFLRGLFARAAAAD